MKIQRIIAIFSIILFFSMSIYAQNFIQINGNLKSGTPINNLVLSRFNGQEIPVTDTKVNDGKFLFRLNAAAQTKGSFRPFEKNDRYTFAPSLSYQLTRKTKINQ